MSLPTEKRELDQELSELKGFIAELKQDRTAQKEKEKREAWTKYTSLSIVFIAVLAAIAAQWSGKYSSRVLVKLNDATYNQALASDQWSFYQAKSIKKNLYETMRDSGLKGADTSSQSAEAFQARINKYEAEEAKIMNLATNYETLRDAARKDATVASRHGAGMGTSIAIFQISVALASICLVTKKRSLWYLSLGFAIVATLKMLQVWLA